MNYRVKCKYATPNQWSGAEPKDDSYDGMHNYLTEPMVDFGVSLWSASCPEEAISYSVQHIEQLNSGKYLFDYKSWEKALYVKDLSGNLVCVFYDFDTEIH